ncbi:MAG TPA: C13 family peptidase [Steroidobacteraceae bacterium]
MQVDPFAAETSRRGNSPPRELAALLRLAFLRRIDPRQLPGREITIALLGAGLLALWVFIEPPLRARALAISWHRLPDLTFIAAGACALAWLLARLSRPGFGYRQALLVTLAALPLAMAISLAAQKLVSAWLYLLVALVGVYALAYFSCALRALTGRFQHLAVSAGALATFAFVAGTDYLHVNPSLWVRADEQMHALKGADGEWARMARVQFGQQARIDADIAALAAEVPDVPETYFVGFAGYGGQQVFAREIALAAQVVGDIFDTQDGSLRLVNDQRDVEAWPIATEHTLDYALRRLGKVMGAEDILFLALSSHGERDAALKVTNAGLAPGRIRAEHLAQMLRESGIGWHVVVVSACFSGAFVDALASERTIVITAAAADRKSFGCDDRRHLTYFGEAFFKNALPAAPSLRAAFDAARAEIAQREARMGVPPSIPQAHFGAALEAKLKDLALRAARSTP